MIDYKPLQNIAYDHLREMIYGRELKFGVIYSETRLASQLSISRTPIRDALTRLSRERYIDILPNRGFQLHEPDESDIREAYHVRMMVERYCGENLALDFQRSEAQAAVERMQSCLERQSALLECADGVDLRQFWMEDQEFHFAPLRYLNVSAFSMQYDTFLHIFMPQNLKDDYVPERNRGTIGEHRAIIEALRDGDVPRAREAIEAHLNLALGVALHNLRNSRRAERP